MRLSYLIEKNAILAYEYGRPKIKCPVCREDLHGTIRELGIGNRTTWNAPSDPSIAFIPDGAKCPKCGLVFELSPPYDEILESINDDGMVERAIWDKRRFALLCPCGSSNNWYHGKFETGIGGRDVWNPDPPTWTSLSNNNFLIRCNDCGRIAHRIYGSDEAKIVGIVPNS